MTTWLIYTLGSIIFLSITELIQQKVLNTKNNLSERVSMGITSFFIGLIAVAGAIYTKQIWGISNIIKFPYLILFIIELVSSYFSIYFYLKSFKVKNISISIILMTVSILVTNFLGIRLFKESFTLIKTVGILLIVGSIFIINFAKNTLEKNHYYALIAGVLFGINYTLDKQLVLISSPLSYLGILLLLVATLSFIFNVKTFTKQAKLLNPSLISLLFLSGILYFAYNSLTFLAYENGGEVGRIDALNNSYIFIIILIEYFLFKQKENTIKKVIASVIGIVGVFVLGYYK